ncbi:MAG: hypothetical protein LBB59_07075, partial [Campylobacteraceae bacterium]|nr:hypothetical protein [Campylobacteraceae bacterium]
MLVSCGGGGSGGSSPSYTISFYDTNLDIDHTFAANEGIVTLPSSTWYEANQTSPVSNNYNLTASVN